MGENRHGILGTYSGDGDGDNPLLQYAIYAVRWPSQSVDTQYKYQYAPLHTGTTTRPGNGPVQLYRYSCSRCGIGTITFTSLVPVSSSVIGQAVYFKVVGSRTTKRGESSPVLAVVQIVL